jgi:hypothetical protein
VGFLLFVAFVPYPTELMATQLAGGSDMGRTLAMLLYGGTFVAIAIMFNAICSTPRRALASSDPASTSKR